MTFRRMNKVLVVEFSLEIIQMQKNSVRGLKLINELVQPTCRCINSGLVCNNETSDLSAKCQFGGSD